MPRGVTDQFLAILKNERRGSLRAAAVAAGLVPLAYFMAELTDEPLLGPVVLLTLAALALGGALGVLWGRHQTAQYNESLRGQWNQWMRMSLSCTRVDEVARHAAGKGPAPPVASVGWSALLVLNAALFAVLWAELAWGMTFGLFVALLNGLVLGSLAGHAFWHWRWSGDFSKALDELISEGQVGLWGEV